MFRVSKLNTTLRLLRTIITYWVFIITYWVFGLLSYITNPVFEYNKSGISTPPCITNWVFHFSLL